MKINPNVTSFIHTGSAIACTAVFLLAGCGGGSGSPGAATTTPPVSVLPPPVVAPLPTLSGTVAVGAPMLNAVVTVKDANGVVVSAKAGADGKYSGVATAALVAPFRVQACGLVDGTYTCFYTVVAQAGIANVTPLTNANVALALGSDPSGMFKSSAPTAPPAAIDMDLQRAKIKAALADLLAKAGITEIDFATTPFTADRTGIDKVLDSVKITTGTDGATNQAFVQVEGKIGDGNVFLNKDKPLVGAVTAGTGGDTDLKGISTIFVNGLSNAIAAADQATCVTRLTSANIFDDSFLLEIDHGVSANKATAPALICKFADMNHLLGGGVANPVLHDCDFSADASKKVCTVGFTFVNGDASFDGAELAVVLRPGADWKLLGQDSSYRIHVGAAVQRTTRVDLPAGAANNPPAYTRNLTFDISGDDGVSGTGVRAAKIYQRNLDGSGWEITPMVSLTLTDTCIAQLQPGQQARLSLAGYVSCGAGWLSLGATGDSASLAASGDTLIDNFYQRGRKVKVELFNNVAFAGTPVVVVKRVDGIPPKMAALPNFPWLELDATSSAALATYEGVAPGITASWVQNPLVGAKDMSLCLSNSCQGTSFGGHTDILNGHDSQTLQLLNKPANAAAYKRLGLYGRTHEQLGVSTSYQSCGGAAVCQ